jgi:hypothetical protein
MTHAIARVTPETLNARHAEDAVQEIYVSTDIEADGPIPGPHSMLSLGSAAYTGEKQLLSTFSANLETLPGAAPDPKTAAWWAQSPAAWAASNRARCSATCCAKTSTPAKASADWIDER